MSQNRKALLRNDRGEVGIGTLIVFIAMILVAAVAAAVLINTSGVLQQRALSTGKATSNEVASNLKILDVYGNRTGGAGDIRGMAVQLQLTAGGLAIDVDRLYIHFVDDSGSVGLLHGDTANATTFTADFVRENSPANNRLEAGEIVQLNWVVDVEPREHISFTLNPEVGNQATWDYYVPVSFGSQIMVPLR